MAVLRLQLLGGFELRSGDGLLLRLPTRKSEALLTYLAVERQRWHAREALAALLWGNASERSSLASLRQTLSLIGKCTGPGTIATEGRQLALAPGAIDVDVATFQAACADAGIAGLTRAAQLYRGDLLPSLSVDAPRFDDWLAVERRRLRERAIEALAQLGSAQSSQGAVEDAMQSHLRLLELDPLSEDAHRELMQCYARLGRRAAALRQYQVYVNALQRELGVAPEERTRQLYNALLRQQLPASEAPATASAAASGPASARDLSPVEGSVHEAPLTGRDAELTQLQAALDAVLARHGRVVALLGEAGVGKSRLTEELAAHAVGRGLRVLLGRSHESQQLFPLTPWAELLRGSGLTTDAAVLESLEPAWRDELATLLPELAARAGHRHGQEPDDGRGDDGTPALAQQARLFEAIVQVLAGLVARSPVLLLLEDLHWSDSQSLRLLTQVARRARDWPLLLLVTAREEDLSDAGPLRNTLRELDTGQRLTRIVLPPLSRSQTAQLVDRLRRSDADSAHRAQVAERVWHASEGNPFVIVEATHAIDEATIGIESAIDSGVGSPAGRGGAPSLPERVLELVRGQLERLGPAARRLLSVLAVAGRELDFGLLQSASGQDAQQASEALEELVRRRVLRLVGEAFDFKHARIRQVADEAVLAPLRAGLHRSLAQAIEQHFAADRSSVNDRLAYHYARTDQHDKAVYYLGLLAQRAGHEGAHDLAIASVVEALRHLSSGAWPDRETQRRALVFCQARSLFFLGRFPEVLALLLPEQAAVAAAGDPRQAAAYHLRLASTYTYLGQHDPAVAHAEQALHEARACNDEATMGKAHFQLSLEHFWARPRLGVQHGEQAVVLLHGPHDRWWLGQACWILGLNLSYRGRHTDGLAMEERARDMAAATGDRRLASYAAWTTGFIHTLAGDFDEAVQACRRSVELSLDPLNRMTAQGMLALALVERGDSAEANAVLEQAIPSAVRFHIPQMHGLFLAFRGDATLQQGNLDNARDFAAEGARITRQARYIYGLGWAQRVQARIALACQDRAAAEALLAQATATFEGMEAPFEAARTRLEWAELLSAAGCRAAALAQASQAAAGLAGLQAPRHAARASALLALLSQRCVTDDRT